jgi:hypothetical protein
LETLKSSALWLLVEYNFRENFGLYDKNQKFYFQMEATPQEAQMKVGVFNLSCLIQSFQIKRRKCGIIALTMAGTIK